MKLACVIHRFGADIAGGSEGHCRGIAERLALRHDVTVLTTCARDHVTWRNEYPARETQLGSLRVLRFPVARTRSLHRFAEISEVVFTGKASAQQQEDWFRANGPETPALVEYLREHRLAYDLFLFWCFRYYPTYFGLPLVASRAVLLPTAEADPVMRLDRLGDFFSLPAGLLFLTPEEQTLVGYRTSGPLAKSAVIGAGLESAGPTDGSAERLAAHGILEPFALYLGRIDPNKGCETLLRHFLRYRTGADRDVQLVMAGPANMPIPEHPSIKSLGFVDEATREALISRAAALIVPSLFESLSLVLLEAWNHETPALVNGLCAVLKGQALRANGALYYRNFDEFAAGLTYLVSHPAEARQIGAQGLAYVDREYRWPHVMQKVETFLGTIAGSQDCRIAERS